MSKDTSGTTFPVLRDVRYRPEFDHEPGMTLRQYIAIKAMEGVLANSDAPSWITAKDIKRIKEVAFLMADEMLAGGGES